MTTAPAAHALVKARWTLRGRLMVPASPREISEPSRGAPEEEGRGFGGMQPSDTAKPEFELVADEGIVGVGDLPGQDAEDDIFIRPQRMRSCADIESESGAGRKVSVVNRPSEYIAAHVEVGRKGDGAPGIE